MTYLRHYGTLGMRWGVHKARSSAFRERAASLSKTATNKSDIRRFNYAKLPVAGRIARTVGGAIVGRAVGIAISSVIRGKSPNYKELYSLGSVKQIAGGAARKFVTNEILARSAASKYDKSGKLVKSNPSNDSRKTKEDYIDFGIKVASLYAPNVKILAQRKMISILDQRRANKEIFEKWGPNILSSKLENVIWQSDDLSAAIIENTKPSGWH